MAKTFAWQWDRKLTRFFWQIESLGLITEKA
jgi:hypothetical protein